MRIYLCGPINGCTDDEATTWREWMKSPNNFSVPFNMPEFLDPMKRDYRGRETDDYREIVELDKRDIRSCDAVVAMFVRPSVGTSMEILYAWQREIPVVLINESKNPLSPWLLYHSTAIVESKEEAVELLKEWQL